MGVIREGGPIVITAHLFSRARTAALAVGLVALAAVGGLPVRAAAEVLAPGDRAIYARAFDAAAESDWARAHRLAAQADAALLADVLTWRHMRDSDAEYTFAERARFVDTHPDWPLTWLLTLRAEQTITGTEPPERLIQWFAQHPPTTGSGKMHYANALWDMGQRDQALNVAREAWRTEIFSRADERRFVARFGDHLTEEDHRARVDALLWDGHTVSATRMLRRLDDGWRRLSQARIGLMKRSRNVDALVARVPKSLKSHPGLVYERLRWRRVKGYEERAAELFKAPTANGGRPEHWWRERAYLSRWFLERGYISKAYDIARNHGLTSGGAFAEAEWLAGWIALRFLKEPDTALAHFTRLFNSVSYPISVARATYWAGRAAEAAGKPTEAQEWFRKAAAQVTTYYGQLAAARLETAPRLPKHPRPTPQDRQAFAGMPLVQVARALVEIGREEDIHPFLYSAFEAAETPGQQALIVDYARTAGRLDAAVYLSRRAALKGVELTDTAYPLPEFDLPLEPEGALVLALIRQESNFNTEAVSSAGARGLMQLMPHTASSVARELGVAHDQHRLTQDPAHNVLLGAAYLQKLIDKFNGSYPLAVAAYNAGPARLDRWLELFGDPRDPDVDAVDWVETIPFRETRNYVQRVLESVQVYRSRLGTGALAANIENDLTR